jgi:hypothetical protein
MNMTAVEIAKWALAEIEVLAESGKYRNDTHLYRELAALSDLSASTIRQFRQGTQPHPRITNLDNLVAGIKAAQRLHAA